VDPAIMGFRMDHGALQSPNHMSGVICHRLCIHHPPHLYSSRADKRQHYFAWPTGCDALDFFGFWKT